MSASCAKWKLYRRLRSDSHLGSETLCIGPGGVITVMGHLGDVYSMATSFLVPLICFIFIAVYGFTWTKLSQSEGVVGMKASGGH